ncbi:MAG: MarR family winged helix-turn-helix transcriptional regulator [Alphaproteobacteria bacterium]
MTNNTDPKQSLGFLLHDISRLMRRDFNRRVEGFELTQVQWRTLAHLARHEGVRQVALAEILEIQPITLARLIDRLQALELVERRPDPDDRRAIQLYLTSKAQPVLDALWDQSAQTREAALEGFSESQCEQLIHMLIRVKANLGDAVTITDAQSLEPTPSNANFATE